MPAQGSDRPWSYLPESGIIANCSWPHQGENVALYCLHDHWRSFAPVLALSKNFHLSSSATLSAVFWACPDGTFRPPQESMGVFLAVPSQLLLPLSWRILLAETLGNTLAISESLTTSITSFCCGFTCGYSSAPLMLAVTAASNWASKAASGTFG